MPHGHAIPRRALIIGLLALLLFPVLLVLIWSSHALALRDALMAEAQGALPWFARLKRYITAAGIVTSILALIRIII
jgi:hypothetical protein